MWMSIANLSTTLSWFKCILTHSLYFCWEGLFLLWDMLTDLNLSAFDTVCVCIICCLITFSWIHMYTWHNYNFYLFVCQRYVRMLYTMIFVKWTRNIFIRIFILPVCFHWIMNHYWLGLCCQTHSCPGLCTFFLYLSVCM